MPTTVERSVEVAVPISTAYNQWTQFEEFPRFMDNIVEVRQIDDTRLHWVAEVGGERAEWDAEITEQIPDRAIEWHAIGGKLNSGRVEFAPRNGGTEVTVRMEYEPEGMKQTVGALVGVDSASVDRNLERFKDMIESRGIETGAWRGEVHRGEVEGGALGHRTSSMPGSQLPD